MKSGNTIAAQPSQLPLNPVRNISTHTKRYRAAIYLTYRSNIRKLIVHLQKNYDMETLQLNIEKSQFVGLLQTLSVSDKFEIYNTLRKSLLCDRMENLLNTIDADDLSIEEITETIETVRQERYEKGIQYV